MSEPQYEQIDGWRITPYERGPHPQDVSCDEEPVCGYVYRRITPARLTMQDIPGEAK